MNNMFLVKKRAEKDFVVVPYTEVNEDGNLKKDHRIISQGHRHSTEAHREKYKLEEKFGHIDQEEIGE